MPQPQGKSNASIKVLELKPIANKGNLRAFASVQLGGVIIHDLKIVQQLGQKAWVSLPQKEYTNRDGEKRYAPVVELSDTLKAKVLEVVFETWERRAA